MFHLFSGLVSVCFLVISNRNFGNNKIICEELPDGFLWFFKFRPLNSNHVSVISKHKEKYQNNRMLRRDMNNTQIK